jgi:hypothetical protein
MGFSGWLFFDRMNRMNRIFFLKKKEGVRILDEYKAVFHPVNPVHPVKHKNPYL